MAEMFVETPAREDFAPCSIPPLERSGPAASDPTIRGALGQRFCLGLVYVRRHPRGLDLSRSRQGCAAARPTASSLSQNITTETTDHSPEEPRQAASGSFS
jgi:hypothetical protein